ncbi:MAG: redoxin domain-containing protein [Candidatus Omnitrophota bacterium]
MEDFKILSIGEKVLDFELDAYLPDKKDFGKIKFSDVFKKGNWLILFFYPADYTFVCPTELADTGGIYDEIKKMGAELISVSTDTHFVHYAWAASEKMLANIRYPMAADPTHNLSKLFGVYDAGSGLALRGTFIIDPDGKLVASEVNYFPVGRNSDELLRKLRAFKFVRENPANVCPAKWQPGKKTLTPGKDLVGKVGDKLLAGG